jgi:hypothetical protein
MATVKPGVDPAKVEAAIDEEVKKLVTAGPTAAELEQAKTVTRAGFIRGIERIGGFGGKADVGRMRGLHRQPGLLPRVAGQHGGGHAGADKGGRRQVAGVGQPYAGDRAGRAHAAGRGALGRPGAVQAAGGGPKYKVLASTVDRSKGVQVPTQFPS